MRTPRGRVATPASWRHVGLEPSPEALRGPEPSVAAPSRPALFESTVPSGRPAGATPDLATDARSAVSGGQRTSLEKGPAAELQTDGLRLRAAGPSGSPSTRSSPATAARLLVDRRRRSGGSAIAGWPISTGCWQPDDRAGGERDQGPARPDWHLHKPTGGSGRGPAAGADRHRRPGNPAPPPPIVGGPGPGWSPDPARFGASCTTTRWPAVHRRRGAIGDGSAGLVELLDPDADRSPSATVPLPPYIRAELDWTIRSGTRPCSPAAPVRSPLPPPGSTSPRPCWRSAGPCGASRS